MKRASFVVKNYKIRPSALFFLLFSYFTYLSKIIQTLAHLNSKSNMSGNMAWKAGKGAFQKFGGKSAHQDPTIRSVDNAHYRGAKIEKKKEDGQLVFFLNDHEIANNHRKDSAYYEYMGVPEKDAKILSSVVASARFLDNGIRLPVVGYKIGVNTFIELIPGAGDFVGSALSFVLVVLPSSSVSKGPDRKKLRAVMVSNLLGGFVIGLLPIGGDIVDSMMKFNVKNANALEAMLLKRVDHAAKTGRDAEKVGRTTGYQHTGTNGRHIAATNGHPHSEPPTHQPPRYITANDLRQDPRPEANARAPVVQAQPKKSGGNFFRRRGAPQGGQDVAMSMEEVAPARPSRPKHSVQERGGHF